MVDIFDVVADGTRRRLLRSLLEGSRGGGELSVGELVAELELSQPTVSKHLKVLRGHGLVTVREEGQHRYYRIDAEPFAELEEWLAPFRGTRPLADRPPVGKGAPAPSAARAPGDIREMRPQDAAAVALWEGAEAAGRTAGRIAADAAHTARITAETVYGRLFQTGARLEQGRKRAADRAARLVDRVPFGRRKD